MVRRLGDVLLKVDAGELDCFSRIDDVSLVVFRIGQFVERNPAAKTERQIELRDLVILRHVGVEVILPVPLHDLGGGAVEELAGDDGALDRAGIENGEGTGQSETGRAGERVGWLSELNRAGAEHFALRFQLHVNFKPDARDILG